MCLRIYPQGHSWPRSFGARSVSLARLYSRADPLNTSRPGTVPRRSKPLRPRPRSTQTASNTPKTSASSPIGLTNKAALLLGVEKTVHVLRRTDDNFFPGKSDKVTPIIDCLSGIQVRVELQVQLQSTHCITLLHWHFERA